MRIERLRARLRRNTIWSIEPKYYNGYASLKAFGENLKVEILPYDGKAFLHWGWCRQDNEVWYGHSANGLVPAALIDYGLIWRKKTKANKKYYCPLTRFSESYDDIIVNYTYSLEGKWVGNYELITVLETTRMQVKFKAERHKLLLPPGTTVCLSPLTLMQKLGENISIEKNHDRLPPEVMEVFTSTKTPQELAARLELEPIRLQERLTNNVEVMRR